MGHKELWDLKLEKDAIYMKPDFSEEDGHRASDLEAKFADMDGWNAESDAAALLSGLGIKETDHYKLVKELNGNEKVRVLLAQTLFGNPDILILDEPTNDLDIQTISWLEDYLLDFKNTLIVVSHDRHFLDTVCTHVADIDFGQIKLFKPSNRKYPAIIFNQNRTAGDQILEIEKLSKESNGEYLFKDLDLFINRGDKIAIVSDDSLAVTTFFQILMNIQSATSGSFKFGQTITPAYLPNENSSYFNTDDNLIDWLRQYSDGEKDEVYIRGFLGKMLFSGQETLKKCNVLSGGEKVRCMVSRMMLQGANLLILDEPTNHLDLESITAFNNSLKDFPGTVLFTSHDHTFTQTIANRVLELKPDGFVDTLSTYDDYLEKKQLVMA
jgi:ATPase subunit of ABC transporter with duplicated ATPase domains